LIFGQLLSAFGFIVGVVVLVLKGDNLSMVAPINPTASFVTSTTLPTLSVVPQQPMNASAPLAVTSPATSQTTTTPFPNYSQLKQWVLSHRWVSGLSLTALFTLLAHRPMLSLIQKLRPAKPVKAVMEENIKGQWEEVVNKFFKKREYLEYLPLFQDEFIVTQSATVFLKQRLEKLCSTYSIVTPQRANQYLYDEVVRALSNNPAFQEYWDTSTKVPRQVQLDTAVDEQGKQILTATLKEP
jgi:hypothetical protein